MKLGLLSLFLPVIDMAGAKNEAFFDDDYVNIGSASDSSDVELWAVPEPESVEKFEPETSPFGWSIFSAFSFANE